MAHIPDVGSIKIDDVALELMPEAIARNNLVLPVRLEPGGLRVIIPDDAEFDQCETIEKLRFVLEREVIVNTADRDAVRDAVDYHYRARYGDITNCQPKFKFQCPKQWSELSPTADQSVRFCEVCRQNVFLCFTDTELMEHASKGHCVALAGSADAPDSIGLLMNPGES